MSCACQQWSHVDTSLEIWRKRVELRFRTHHIRTSFACKGKHRKKRAMEAKLASKSYWVGICTQQLKKERATPQRILQLSSLANLAVDTAMQSARRNASWLVADNSEQVFEEVLVKTTIRSGSTLVSPETATHQNKYSLCIGRPGLSMQIYLSNIYCSSCRPFCLR